MNTQTKQAWSLAIFSVLFLWGINNVMLGVGSKVFEGNAIIYSCTAFATGALSLLLYAGHGPLAKETMRSIDTWLYGITLLIGYSLSFILYFYLSSTEGTLLQRFSVIISLLIGWFFLSRKPTAGQILGAGFVITGIILILQGVPLADSVEVYTIMIAFAIFQALRIFAAEYHRPHAQASSQSNSPKAKARVVGCVMFIVSMFFTAITFSLAYLQSSLPQDQLITGLPVIADFFNTSNILLGLFAGGFILAPLLLIEFSASQTIKTENYLALTSLAALSTWGWEYLASFIVDVSLKDFSNTDIIACLLITTGGIMIAVFKYKQSTQASYEQYLKLETQNLKDIEETRDIIAHSLEHFNSDFKKTANALNLPTNVIKAIFNDEEKQLSFNYSIIKEVSRNYRKNIAASDSLTGLLNRSGFMTELKIAANEADNLSLFFIDLNKFKPVNDTYGHNAGDYILQETATRLETLFPKKSLITRLGGDEYCILLIGTSKKEALLQINSILKVLEQDFTYMKNTINISGSIGLASYPEDTKQPEKLLELADKQMYINKNER